MSDDESIPIRPQYDCIIVGGGISGLVSARELAKRHPSWTIALAERYKGLGGRTYSYWPPGFDGIHWEMGAGRVHTSHTHLMALLKEYGLTWVPIGSDIGYQAHPGDPVLANPFEDTLVPIYIESLQRLPAATLAKHTVEELMNQIYGQPVTKKILSYFPYRAEVNTMRADLALEELISKKGVAAHEGYGVIAEGFSELVKRLREDCDSRGVVILNRHRLLNCLAAGGNATDLLFSYDSKKEGGAAGKIQLRAEKAVVLALHKDAVAELPVFRGWKTLEHIKTQPLLRTYAIFPVKKGTGVWFDGMGRVVTPERPRFILPMNPKEGTIMISYTDGDDTKEYSRILDKGGDKALEKTILSDVRRLFPAVEIPKPRFFRSHMWETGCSYWLPGDYDPVKESEAACHPLSSRLPGVWLCGESWSLKQAWVEGALEQTLKMLNKMRG